MRPAVLPRPALARLVLSLAVPGRLACRTATLPLPSVRAAIRTAASSTPSLVALVAALLAAGTARAVDDDLLAHSLYTEGRYAEAAEIFTDPAWKGVALYRSGQWWRAADAFVRADDPLSAYNLGNCYVRLGYPALALEAYRRALAADPMLEDARFNAELVLALLESERDEDARHGGRAASDDELERIGRESDDEEEAGAGEGGREDAERGERGPGETPDGERNEGATSETAERGESGEAGDGERDADAGDGGGARHGERGEEAPASRASGIAEAATASADSEAAGLRSALESEQATEQWLNRIAHDPRRYLEKRIALELRRRRAAGQSAPEGGSVW